MARLTPKRSACLARMSGGERRFSERLERLLEDDYLIWYDVPVAPRQQRPDFILLHPGRGLLALEVKDWKTSELVQADGTQCRVQNGRSLHTQPNPLLTARQHVQEIKQLLQRDGALQYPTGHRLSGQLALPLGYGVVLSRISRRQFEQGGLERAIPAHRVICQDEMLETVAAETFQQRLWAMFEHVFPLKLSLPQIERVRWHLFPELRMAPALGQFGLFPAAESATDDDTPAIPALIGMMDSEQERLARSLGEGHRLVHGVAGSGKTMILGYRALQLACSQGKPILILCYNPTLAGQLAESIGERGLGERVSVRAFHAWCEEMLITYHVKAPTGSGSAYEEALPPALIDAVERGRIPRAQYGAVLIDEGQEFAVEWYRLVVQMIDPASKALLVMYDATQRQRQPESLTPFSWKSAGVEAVGHTTILKLNYRNSVEIIQLARDFARQLLEAPAALAPPTPDSSGRHGPLPELLRLGSVAAEDAAVIARIRQEQAAGRPLHEIALLFRQAEDAARWQTVLRTAGIAYAQALGAGRSSLYLQDDSVKLVAISASQGLEWPQVLIPGLGALPLAGEPEEREARLLYIAMTRARDALVMFHSEDSAFSRRIREAIHQIQAQLAPESATGNP